jgi:hypothetical protein
MGKVNGPGLIAGIISWLVIMWYAASQSECLNTKSCDGGNLVLFAIIGIGMLAPSWIFASIVSIFFEKNK